MESLTAGAPHTIRVGLEPPALLRVQGAEAFGTEKSLFRGVATWGTL